MPTKTTGWRLGTLFFADLREAQAHELKELLATDDLALVGRMVEHADAIVRILSIKEKRPRSDRGGKHRKPSAAAVNRALQDMKQ